MVITASSTFTRLNLSRDTNTEQVTVAWFSPDGNGYVINALTNLDDAGLAILQEIYASADGFGSAIVQFGNYPVIITTLDEIETHGFWNPLDAGSYNRWIAKQKAVAAYGLEEAEVTTDAVSGRVDISFAGGRPPIKRTPSTGMMKLDLKDWSLRTDGGTVASTLCWLVYEAPEGGDFAPQLQLGKLAPIRALLKWLDSVHYSGMR